MIDRARVTEFIQLRKIQITVIAIVVLVVLLITLVIVLLVSGAATASTKNTKVSQAEDFFTPGELWIPEEPLQPPGVQLFREPRQKWSKDDAKPWYTVPDAKSLDELRAYSRKQIDDILESVP